MTILLFPNVRMVIKAEKFLLHLDMKAMVRPVPTNITAECGMCLEVNDYDVEAIFVQLQGAGFKATITKM